MDFERNCEFNRITPKEIITYNFAATINDKKARDKIIKGPLELRTVLETIELENYNRKYGDKKQRNKKSKRAPSNSSSSGEQNAFTKPVRKRRPLDTKRKKPPLQNCHSCGKPNCWTPEHNCPARNHSVIFSKRLDILPGFAKARP